MAMRDILDRQASSIEYVLHTHGIQARIDGGKLSPRLAHFNVVLPPGVRAQQIAPLLPELSAALGVMGCRLAPDGDGVYVEVPRADPVPVRLLPLVQRVTDVVPPVASTLGLDTEGTPLLLRLNSPDVDPVLVSGDHKAGKSGLLRGMALSMSLHNSPDRLRLLLIDCTGDGVAFRGLEELPHLACPTANGPVEGLLSLRWALRVLEKRTSISPDDELLFDEVIDEDYGLGQQEEPALAIIIDGADRLLYTGNRRADAEALAALNRLLEDGGRHEIHAVVSTERPDGVGEINAQWGARIAGWAASPEMARLATGVKGSGAQALLGAGDFLISLNAELIRFQAAAISSGDIAKAVDLISKCMQTTTQPGTEPEEGQITFASRDHRERADAKAVRQQPVQLRRNWAGE